MAVAPVIPAWLAVVVPWAGAALLAALPRWPAPLGPAVAAASLAVAVATIGWGGDAARSDALGAALLVAGAATALLAATASAAESPDRGEADRFSAACLPLLQGAQALALLAVQPVVIWIGLAVATGAGAAMTALGGGRRGFAAAWRMLRLCGAGLAMALLGAALLGVRGAGGSAGLPLLGFVLLLLGYGALAGLAPMHAWLPRTVAVAPPAVAAALAGLLPPAALFALLRAAAVVGPGAEPLPPAALLVAAGSATALLAALSVWRRPGGALAKEAPGWGVVGSAGLAAVGFGLAGAAGNLAGALLLLGLPFCVGAAVFGAAAGASTAAAAVLGRVSLAALPPFAPFAGLASLFSAVAALPAHFALPLGAALLLAVAGQLRALSAFPATAEAGRGGLLAAGPAWVSVGLALALGAALPGPVAAVLAEAAARLPR